MIKVFTSPESVAMFRETGVYSEKELQARNEVKWETYSKMIAFAEKAEQAEQPL